jgi:hypothetical protein
MEQNDILDPAHDPNAPDTNVGAAGIAQPEQKVEDKVSPDGNILERDGRKYIVFDAFKAERESRKTAEQNLATLAPIVDEYQRNKETTRLATQQAQLVSDEKDSPEYLNEVAVSLGMYDEQGQADLRRAQAHLNISRREADRRVDRRVKPHEESTARDRAQNNRERARGQMFVDGRPIADDQYLDAAFAALPEEMAANPQVASLMQIVAAGLQSLDQRKAGGKQRQQQRQSQQVPEYREPMHTEGTTGRFDGDSGELSPLDLAAARARGKTPEQWMKQRTAVNKSQALDEV